MVHRRYCRTINSGVQAAEQVVDFTEHRDHLLLIGGIYLDMFESIGFPIGRTAATTYHRIPAAKQVFGNASADSFACASHQCDSTVRSNGAFGRHASGALQLRLVLNRWFSEGSLWIRTLTGIMNGCNRPRH